VVLGQERDDLIDWLVDYGGPVIRYRTLTELRPDHYPGEIREAAMLVEQSADVQRLLQQLHWTRTHFVLRGAGELDLGNLLLRICWLGCGAGMRSLDNQMEPFIELMGTPAAVISYTHPMDMPVLGNCLAYAGYTREPLVRAWLKRRLDALYDFCQRGTYDIYVDPPRKPARPANQSKVPVIDPGLYSEGELLLPTIYDLYGLSAYPAERTDHDTLDKIETIVAYVMDPRYQQLRDGFGLVVTADRRYNLAGGTAHLEGFFADSPAGNLADKTAVRPARRLRHLVMLAPYFTAFKSRWYMEGERELEKYRTPKGRYLFPREVLPDGLSGNFVNGAHMAVHLRPRDEAARERESTFYMALLSDTRFMRQARLVPPPAFPWEQHMRVRRLYGGSTPYPFDLDREDPL
jgi:hypothetical protein